MQLNELRTEIDKIDDEIVALYKKRMQVVKNVAKVKKENSVAVNQSAREDEIIFRVTENVESELQPFVKKLFQTLFETSKAYQSSFTTTTSPTVELIRKNFEKGRLKFPNRATVACQGVEGAYSSVATKDLFEIPSIMYFKSFEAVFSAVEAGFCQYGLLPIENSSAGSVNNVYDLMREHKFYIVKSISLKVSHNLLVNEGATKESITEIFSHEQALNQCSQYLFDNYKNAKLTVCDNTATSARMVKESGRLDIASISSKESADVFGLKTLDKNIQDSQGNYTRFICISKDMQFYDGANMISFMSTLPHKAGSLNKFLGKFAALGLNLTKLESRPLDKNSDEFMFYFDFVGNVSSPEIQNLIAESENSSEHFAFLGNY
ncbi:MAG: prephenate dehydratase domain-containing protein [Clostridia bacterium]